MVLPLQWNSVKFHIQLFKLTLKCCGLVRDLGCALTFLMLQAFQ